MTYKNFRVITTESKSSPEENVIAINTDIPGNPFLEVYMNGEWSAIDNYGDLERASRFEDLYTTLYEREWGIGGRLFYENDYGEDNLYYDISKYDSSLPILKKKESMFLITEDKNKSREEFENIYTKLMKVKSMNDIKEIDLGNDYYRYLVSTRNLIDGSSIIDLYSYSETPSDYGSIINLNELLQKRDELRYHEGGYSIRLEIMYIKSGSRMSGTLMFDPFLFDKDGKLIFNNFQSIINDDVTVEVKKGCIRLFPESIDITECIIYHCYVIYEKLL